MAADATTSTFGLPGPDTRDRFDRRSGSVAAELDEIFRAPVGPTSAPAPPRARVFAAASAPARAARASAASLGVLAAVLLAGISIGSVLTRPPPPPKAPPPQAAPAAAAPAPPAQAQVTAAPPAPVVVPRAPAAAPAPAAVAPERKASAPPRAASKAASAKASGCQALKGDARARCAYPAVMAADRRLRQAYARAGRAGVSRATLIGYRNRWAALRRQADDQPSRVIAGYGAMAAELNRLAAKARRA